MGVTLWWKWNITTNNWSHLHSNRKRKWRRSYLCGSTFSQISHSHTIFCECRNHCWSWGYVLNCHRSLLKSTVALLTALWSLPLILPPFQQLICSLPSSWRFWAATREQGFWEKDVCLLLRSMRRIFPDWEDKQYFQHFRVSKDTFLYLCQTYGKYFKQQTTHVHYYHQRN